MEPPTKPPSFKMRYDGTHYEPIVPADGGYWVWGRGCTEPGGGIVPSWGFVSSDDPSLIARSTGRNRVVGFGQEEILAPAVVAAVSPSPWQVALVTTMLGAATGWVIEEVARKVRGRDR